MDRINEIIIKRFKSILKEYENDSIEMKVRYLKITLNKIIEQDMDLLDYYRDFYCKKEKLKEIENMKKTGGRNMEKTIQELINEHPKLMNDYKNQIINEIGNSEKEKIEAAIKAERERIQALDKIPTLNDSQKETINKAKFEEPREPKDIMAEFFVSNANKANQEIQAAKDDILKAGLDKIIPSNSDLGDNSVEDEIYKAALNAYNDEEK